VKKREQYKTL